MLPQTAFTAVFVSEIFYALRNYSNYLQYIFHNSLYTFCSVCIWYPEVGSKTKASCCKDNGCMKFIRSTVEQHANEYLSVSNEVEH